MTNVNKAAHVIDTWTQDNTLTADTGNPHDLSQALADAGLLAPDTDDITRITVVNDEGRALEEWGINNLRLDTQDAGRTLKIFYTKEHA